ncbi:MAG: type I methionyl aminopeptidase [Flavobacteriales bacterium]|nr:type I methionyl aminopeptidase [Flavobacteriales bacterium]
MSIRIKTAKQIEGIRKSAKLAAETLKYLEQFAVAGNTTDFINAKAHEFMLRHKAIPATLNYNKFPKSICTSVNDVVCHGIPGEYELKDGDILNIDVTTILDGYYGDTCKMFPIGKISENAQKLIDVTKNCLKIGVDQCYPGNRFGNIGYEINQYAVSQGYSVVYEFCGHGVGVAFHEDPEVCHVADKNSGKRMREGMIFTIEPMINEGKARTKIDKNDGWTARTIDGKLSAQFEHTILITGQGCELLTDVYGEY